MKGMSNVDVYAICTELNDTLKNARVDKAFQPSKDTIIIRFHKTGKGRMDVVFQAGKRLHLTQYPLPNPQVPPSFPMMLRKYLKGGNVKEIRQYNFDRIIELEVKKEQNYTMIIELFAQGNIILLDEEKRIILPLKRKLWTDRKISSKEEYKYPPKRGINPLEVERQELVDKFENSKTDVIRTLARTGLGGVYAEEIISRTGLDKKAPANEIKAEEVDLIYQTVHELFQPLKNNEFNPQIVSNSKEDVLPLNLKIYEKYSKTEFDTFNEAADEFYSSKVRAEIKKVQEDVWGAEIGKYEKRLRLQEETLENFKKTIKESKKKGELLYSNYKEIQNILDIILKARENFSWQEIIKKIKSGKKEGVPGLEIIESLDQLGNLVLKIDGTNIRIDANSTIPENAEVYYEKAKKAKKKIKGVNIAIGKTRKEIEKVTSKKEIAMERITLPQRRVKKELKWYEKFRWFLSSDGLLVIGGRDANTNEIVVKKYMDNNDLYLHSDIHGAPSVVIKKGEGEIPESTVNEAAVFAASFSSAWPKGLGSLDVYSVKPEQVSKTPQSGEFVAKGAFIIRGKRNYIRNVPLQISVGLVDYEGKRIMAGPTKAIEKYTDKYVTIKPGYMKKEALAREILKKIDNERILSTEDVIRVLPSGKADIVNK